MRIRFLLLSGTIGLMLCGTAHAASVMLECKYSGPRGTISYLYEVDYRASTVTHLNDDGTVYRDPGSRGAAKISDSTIEWSYKIGEIVMHNTLNRYSGSLSQRILSDGRETGYGTFQCDKWTRPQKRF